MCDYYEAYPLYGGSGTPIQHVEGEDKPALGFLAAHRRAVQAQTPKEQRSKPATIRATRRR